MLRNSFLMQKDYKIHSKVIDLLFEPEWNDLWDIDVEILQEEEIAVKIMRLSERIRETYISISSECVPTDTLITKILLGSLCCVPAYDRYFRKAVSSTGVTSQQFSETSLMALGRLYMKHYDKFEKLREHCSQNGFLYPPTKILDMCFFEYGLSLDTDTDDYE